MLPAGSDPAVAAFVIRSGRAIVDGLKNAGIALGVYTPNTLHQKRTMISLGVDSITTDRPDQLIALLRGEKEQPPEHDKQADGKLGVNVA